MGLILGVSSVRTALFAHSGLMKFKDLLKRDF